jgi:hypothetical protein
VLKWVGTWGLLVLIAFDAAVGWVRVQGDPHVFWSWDSLYFGGIPPWLPVTLLALPTAVFWWQDRPRRERSGHCQDCGYDLTGNVSGRCPECGKSI